MTNEPGERPQAARPKRTHSRGYQFGASRFLILVAIVGTTASALCLLVFVLIADAILIWHAFTAGDFTVGSAKHLAVELIEMTDLFLLGMVLEVVAIGMYQLFVDPEIAVPAWMRVQSLADLKAQLLNVIVVLLVVSFLATAVSWTTGHDILYFGAGIAVVLLSLAAYNLAQHHHAPAGENNH